MQNDNAFIFGLSKNIGTVLKVNFFWSENLQHLVVTNEQVDIVDNEIVATDGNAELTCPLPSFAQLASVIQFGDKVSHFLDSTRHTVSGFTRLTNLD